MDLPRTRGKVARIVALGVIASAAVVYVARDGSEPPREGMRAEASLSIEQPAAVQPSTRATRTPESRGVDTPSVPLVELERQLAASDPADRELVLEAELPAMVAKNPEELARFAELQTDPRLRELLIRQVAQEWAQTDLDRAMAWANSLPDSPERVATLIDLSLTVAQTDPQRAVNMREPQVGNIEPDGVLENLVQQWALQDFDAALAWANARPHNAQRDKLLQRLVYARASAGQPAEAAKL
ncbi:MAG TPA: hypothetical protein VIV63_14815, partial [Steroidobacteraceae bacterium]